MVTPMLYQAEQDRLAAEMSSAFGGEKTAVPPVPAMTADEIVSRFGKAPADTPPAVTPPPVPISSELREIQALRLEVRDLTALVLQLAKRVGANGGKR